jgi:hypothetical protein
MTTAPMNPLAGVSGPGKYSVRTDNLDMGSTAYGEGVETAAIKAGAPLGKTGNVKGMPASEVRAVAQEPITSLYAQSARPNEPITHGVDMGPGAGSDVLMMNQMKQDDKDIVAKYLPSLSSMASAQDTPESFRAFVSFLQGSL